MDFSPLISRNWRDTKIRHGLVQRELDALGVVVEGVGLSGQGQVVAAALEIEPAILRRLAEDLRVLLAVEGPAPDDSATEG